MIGPDQFEDQPTVSKIQKILMAIGFVLLLPISLPLMLIGYGVIKLSHTHRETCKEYHLFRKNVPQNTEDLSAAKLKATTQAEAEKALNDFLQNAQDLNWSNIADDPSLTNFAYDLQKPETHHYIKGCGQDPKKLTWLMQLYGTLISLDFLSCSETSCKLAKEAIENLLKSKPTLQIDTSLLTPLQYTNMLIQFAGHPIVKNQTASNLLNPQMKPEVCLHKIQAICSPPYAQANPAVVEQCLTELKNVIPAFDTALQEKVKTTLIAFIGASELSLPVRMSIYIALRELSWHSPDLFCKLIVPKLPTPVEERKSYYAKFFQGIPSAELEEYIRIDPIHMSIFINQTQDQPLHAANMVTACRTYVQHHDATTTTAPLEDILSKFSGVTPIRYRWLQPATFEQHMCLINALSEEKEEDLLNQILPQLFTKPLSLQTFTELSPRAVYYVFALISRQALCSDVFMLTSMFKTSPIISEGFKTLQQLETEKEKKLREAYQGMIAAYGSFIFNPQESIPFTSLRDQAFRFINLLDTIYKTLDTVSGQVFTSAMHEDKNQSLKELATGKIQSKEQVVISGKNTLSMLFLFMKNYSWTDDELKLLFEKADTNSLAMLFLSMDFWLQVKCMKDYFTLHPHKAQLLEALKAAMPAEHRQKLAAACKTP